MSESTTSPAQILHRDHVLADVSKLARTWPTYARRAGRQIATKIRSHIDRVNGEKRATIQENVALLEVAKRLVLNRAAMESPSDLIIDSDHPLPGFEGIGFSSGQPVPEWVKQAYEAVGTYDFGVQVTVSHLVDWLSHVGEIDINLAEVSALDAFVNIQAARRKMSESEVRRELDSAKAVNMCATPCGAMAHIVVAMLRDDPARQRTIEEWWEIAMAVLVCASPEFHPAQIEIDVLPEWSDTNNSEPFWGGRGELLKFSDSLEGSGTGTSTFWLLAERAAIAIQRNLDETIGDAPDRLKAALKRLDERDPHWLTKVVMSLIHQALRYLRDTIKRPDRRLATMKLPVAEAWRDVNVDFHRIKEWLKGDSQILVFNPDVMIAGVDRDQMLQQLLDHFPEYFLSCMTSGIMRIVRADGSQKYVLPGDPQAVEIDHVSDERLEQAMNRRLEAFTFGQREGELAYYVREGEQIPFQEQEKLIRMAEHAGLVVDCKVGKELIRVAVVYQIHPFVVAIDKEEAFFPISIGLLFIPADGEAGARATDPTRWSAVKTDAFWSELLNAFDPDRPENPNDCGNMRLTVTAIIDGVPAEASAASQLIEGIEALARQRGKLIELKSTSMTITAPKGNIDEPRPRLNDGHFECLEAMRILKATKEGLRKNADEIARKARGPTAEANDIKELMADLSRARYVNSRTGRRGGSWLNKAGIEALRAWKKEKR